MGVEQELIRISVGCHAEIVLLSREGKKECLSIDLVLDEAADYANGFLGVSTPLAKILLGETKGTIVPYLKDDILAVEILAVSPSTVKPPEDAAEKREEMMKITMRKVEDTNAMVFASSFSGKWGDYDPDSIPKEGKSKTDELGD